MKLKDKVALVTGSAYGIGRATIIELAKQGCNVVIHYNKSENSALELKNIIEKDYQVKAITIKADITNEKEVVAMTNEIVSTFSHIDILVNNAALALDNEIIDKTKEEFLSVISTNLLGTFLVTKIIGQLMKDRKEGKIINISSTNGIDQNNTYSVDYDASKAGIISLTKNFAVEYAPYINVNCVAPGWTKTPPVLEMNPNIIKDEEKKILLQRFAEPEEIAKVITFLATTDASYINGEVIRVDGGIRG